MKTTFTVITCLSAQRLGLNPPRAYGYTIRQDPPHEFTTDGGDIEGIGWWPRQTRRHVVHCRGWYRHRETAVQRAAEKGQP